LSKTNGAVVSSIGNCAIQSAQNRKAEAEADIAALEGLLEELNQPIEDNPEQE